MGWWAKCLLYKYEVSSWIISIYVKRLALWRESLTPAQGQQRRADPRGLLASQSSQHGKFNENSRIKIQDGESQRKIPMLPSGSLCSFRAKVTHILKEKRKKNTYYFSKKENELSYNFYETKNNLKNKKQKSQSNPKQTQ